MRHARIYCAASSGMGVRHAPDFASAESLKEFSRDNLPNESYFVDILDQFFEGLKIILYDSHKDGFDRMIAAHKLATSMQIDANILCEMLRPNDRIGMCHQLSNQDKIKWVIE